MGRLEGKVAIVTGAARGTGEATARHFVAEGARVLIGDVLDERAQAVAESLGESARALHLDVTSETDWSEAVAFAQRELGPLTVLVNNAAVLHVAALVDTPPKEFERLLRVNLYGPFLGIRAVVPALREAGGGSIVNIGSIDSLLGMNGVSAYCASKFGLRGLTKAAALELGRSGIRVNTVCPATGSREMILPFLPDSEEGLKRLATSMAKPALVHREPIPHEERLAEVARMVGFLASDESLSCTGGDYPVDAGFSAGKIVEGAPGS